MEETRDFSYLDRNLAQIRQKLAAAAARSPYGQEPRLLLASKYATAEEMNYCAAAGVRLFGENRVPALLEKIDRLDLAGGELHFIGSLQTNKAKYVVGRVALIHSLDSLKLAEEIEKQAAKRGIVQDVLVEINSGREENKGGILPEEADRFLDEAFAFSHLRVRGLMTMAPVCREKEEYRKYFRETYQIFIDIFEKKRHNIGSYNNTSILSMGMSDSFEIAVEEGANLVRLGRAAFAK
ncbi:MAG: YggS family pyridoxal phosphate-dependent enzyme [Clostridia bacterium]|nr:YggS family pyridoxal phosphate-dependent enzyme [Clostridia bacterium]